MAVKLFNDASSSHPFPLLKPLANLEIDFTFLHTHFGNKEAPLQEMLNLFLIVVEPQVELLTRYREEGNWIGFSHSLHKIKSSFHYLGFHELLKTADWLEQAVLQQTNSAKMESLIKDFCQGLKIAIALVKDEVIQRPNSANQ